MSTARVKILCVDDEPLVLEGLQLHLHRLYEVRTAPSGLAGLRLLDEEGPFAVVLSDMRMPEMDGAAFLGHVRSRAPDSVRMLLTGHAEVGSAAAAINEGQIFRFLTKPCLPAELKLACAAAVEQHRLLTSERELLEQTLRGAVRALIDVLSIASPLAFGRAARLQQRVQEMAGRLGPRERWLAEVAAMLSQLGAISLPDELLERLNRGEVLGAPDQAAVARSVEVTQTLLANIPRLEPVREVLTRFAGGPAASALPPAEPEIAHVLAVLRVAAEYDELESRGVPAQVALDTLRGRRAHDPATLEEFAVVRDAAARVAVIREVPLAALQAGMVVADDLRTSAGVLLVGRGFRVTASLLQRLASFKGGIRQPIRVIQGGGK